MIYKLQHLPLVVEPACCSLFPRVRYVIVLSHCFSKGSAKRSCIVVREGIHGTQQGWEVGKIVSVSDFDFGSG